MGVWKKRILGSLSRLDMHSSGPGQPTKSSPSSTPSWILPTNMSSTVMVFDLLCCLGGNATQGYFWHIAQKAAAGNMKGNMQCQRLTPAL